MLASAMVECATRNKSHIMTSLQVAMASAAWLIACSACGQPSDAGAGEGWAEPNAGNGAGVAHAAQDRHRAVFGYLGYPGGAQPGPPGFFALRFSGIDHPEPDSLDEWLDVSRTPSVVSVGYAWHAFEFEGSTVSWYPADERRPARTESLLHLDARSTRLSFRPSDRWTFQVSRSTLVGLDQVVPSGGLRRSAISATYRQPFTDGEWQATLAWGRTARKFNESVNGYLLESAVRFQSAHTVFGRLEQVGRDDLLRDVYASQRVSKFDKLTLGYYKDMQSSGPLKFDVGVLMSKHFVPAGASQPFGSEPVSYMLFMRLRLE